MTGILLNATSDIIEINLVSLASPYTRNVLVLVNTTPDTKVTKNLCKQILVTIYYNIIHS